MWGLRAATASAFRAARHVKQNDTADDLLACRCPQERMQRAGHSVLARVDAEADDCFLAERLGGLQPVQAGDQDKARAVRPYQDRRLLTVIEHAGSDFVDALLLKRGAPFDRHVNVGDDKSFALHRIANPNFKRGW
jgi:hypothetical protein